MERTCAECRYFRVTEAREDASIGRCRLEKVIGVFRDSMRACSAYSRKGETSAPAPVRSGRSSPRRARTVTPARRPEVTPERIGEALTLPAPTLKAVIVDALSGARRTVERPLGRTWDSATLVLQPADSSLKAKEVPFEQFFRKLTTVRDNLRVLEQKINSHKTLHDGEKIDLQRRVSLVHDAVAGMATDWLPDTGPEEGGGATR